MALERKGLHEFIIVCERGNLEVDAVKGGFDCDEPHPVSVFGDIPHPFGDADGIHLFPYLFEEIAQCSSISRVHFEPVYIRHVVCLARNVAVDAG